MQANTVGILCAVAVLYVFFQHNIGTVGESKAWIRAGIMIAVFLLVAVFLDLFSGGKK